MTLDQIDFAMIEALQNNARLTNKELAAKINLAPSSCLTRMRTLVKTKVIQGYHAEINASAMGIGVEALIAVRLTKHARTSYQRVWMHIMALPEVLSLLHVSGAFDLQVHVALRDVAHLRDFIMDSLATRPEVDRFETSIIYRGERRTRLPRYIK